MSFIGAQLFDFTKRAALQSRFSHSGLANHLSQRLAPKRVFKKPQVLYQQLQQGQVSLSLIDVLMLIGWRSEVWLSESGRVAMQHWWQSALADTAHPILRLIMMLRVVLADSEQWPGPRAVIQAMSDEMQIVLQNSGWPNQPQADVLLLLVHQNTEALAELAISQSISVHTLVQQVNLPTHLPTVLLAEEQWTSLWVSKDRPQRTTLAPVLHRILHTGLTLKRQQDFTKCFLHHAKMPQKPKILKSKVAAYPEIVSWLSLCVRQPEFRLVFNDTDKQLLRCWIGTGNYEALKDLLIEIATQHADAENLKKTESRYIFWATYQDLFEETWLLIPPKLLDNSKEIQQRLNVRPITDTLDPIAVLKIGDYYIFQTFIGAGNSFDADLIVTSNTDAVELLLKKPELSYTAIKELDLCLIHDHKYLWQVDLAFTLEKELKILPPNGRNSSYIKQANDEKFMLERRREIKSWLRKAVDRHPIFLLEKVAFSAIRHRIL